MSDVAFDASVLRYFFIVNVRNVIDVMPDIMDELAMMIEASTFLIPVERLAILATDQAEVSDIMVLRFLLSAQGREGVNYDST